MGGMAGDIGGHGRTVSAIGDAADTFRRKVSDIGG